MLQVNLCYYNISIKINCRHKLEQMKENLPEIITSVLKQ